MARRLTQVNIDWARIAERVLPEEMGKFQAFRTRSDGFLKKMYAFPENPPKIDWAFYKKNVPIPGMVDNFQKTYESLQIPYPKDTVSGQIDAQEKEIKADIAAFTAASNQRIVEYNTEVNRLQSLLPVEQMTMEEYCAEYNEFDPKNPTFWPHTPEEQPGYKEDTPQVEAKH